MKKLRILTLLVLILIGNCNLLHAQDRVAHIDVQKLIDVMPEMKIAQAELDKFIKVKRFKIDKTWREIANKYYQLESQVNSLTLTEYKKREREIQDLEIELKAFEHSADKELEKKQTSLLSPILEKANRTIIKVAKALGYTYVLNSSQGQGVILADGKNLFNDVKRELGF